MADLKVSWRAVLKADHWVSMKAAARVDQWDVTWAAETDERKAVHSGLVMVALRGRLTVEMMAATLVEQVVALTVEMSVQSMADCWD